MNKRIKRMTLAVCAVMTLVWLCSCNGGGDQTSSAASGNGDGSGQVQILKIADFGAVGDGVTNDYQALNKAVNEAKKLDAPVRIEFEKDKTYFFGTRNKNNVAVSLNDGHDISFVGDNTTFMVDKMVGYFSINESKNVTIKGFNFKFKRLPYTMGKALKVDKAQKTIDLQTEDSLGIDEDYTFENEATFAIPDALDQGRLHIMFRKIEVLDAAKNQYRLHCSDGDGFSTRMDMVAGGVQLITPIPDVGQMNGSAFAITHSENVTLEDINMWSASTFVFHCRYNSGDFLIKNVNMVPEPGTYGKMVSWRDGFHLKENRAAFTWENCKLSGVFDDIFNFSCSMLNVTEVISNTEFVMGCPEFNGSYFMELQPGDEISVYNPTSGAFLGRTKIKEVVKQEGADNHIIVEDPLDGLVIADTFVAVDSLSSPKNVIKNCYFDGTFRFRSSVKIYDSEFKVTYGWIENEQPFEGPIPRDILFKNCKVYGLNDRDQFMSIGATTSSGFLPEYNTKNIVFEDCEINPAQLYIRQHSDVKVIKDGKTVFQSE